MKLFSLIAIAAVCLAGAVNAEDKPQGDASAQDASQIGMRADASGKVTSVHNVDMVGGADNHTLIKLLGDDGETDVVDLGSSAELKTANMEPKEGQSLWVSGRIGKINDKVILVAEHVSQAKMMSVTRQSLREESQKHADKRGAGETAAPQAAESGARDISPKKETVDAGMQSRTVDGTIVHSRKLKIEGAADEHMLVKLQTEGGMVVVDLGLAGKVPQVDLTEGKFLAASGVVGKLNGKPLIIADAVGNLTNIDWPAEGAATEKK